MEENQTEENSVSTKSSNGSKSLILFSLAILLLLLAGGFVIVKNNNRQSITASRREASNSELTTNDGTNSVLGRVTEDNDGDVDNPTATPSNISSNESAVTDANTPAINIEGGMYYFKPNRITAKKGQPVKIVFTNAEGFHDFVIDEFNVQSAKIKAGESTTFEFTPDKTGSFNFYCSVAGHRQKGMVGTLIVE